MCEEVLLRARVLMRWTLRVGLVLWAILLLAEVGSPMVDLERLWILGLVGGGTLLCVRGLKRSIERGETFRLREAAVEILRTDPQLRSPSWRRSLVAYLLWPDRKLLSMFSWKGRLEELLAATLEGILGHPLPQHACRACGWMFLSTMAHLHPGRHNKSQGEYQPEAPLNEDLDSLQVILASLVMCTAVFRLGTLKWGPGYWPISRGRISHLRRRWIPLCTLEPSHRSLPPALEGEVAAALKANPGYAAEWAAALECWLFRGEREGISVILRGLQVVRAPGAFH
jgi:hypothetical protein